MKRQEEDEEEEDEDEKGEEREEEDEETEGYSEWTLLKLMVALQFHSLLIESPDIFEEDKW
jgi:hypothetical protein